MTPARVFTLTQSEASDSKTVVTGQLSSADTLLTVLFDSGVTHSFMSARLIDQLHRPSRGLHRGLQVILPSGDRVVSQREIRALPVMVDGRELHVDLMELEMEDFDHILCMDMLAKYRANIGCRRQTITFAREAEIPFVFVGSILMSRVPRVSALKVKELLQ